MIVFTFVLCIAIIHSSQAENQNNAIYVITYGSLKRNLEFNFTIKVRHLQGVILHCFDAENNQLGIFVTRTTHIDSYIRVSMNRISKEYSIKHLCGCNPCEEGLLQLVLKLNDKIMEIMCNNRIFESFLHNGLLLSNANKDEESNIYPLPAALGKKPNKMYIIMGNVGAYLTVSNQVNPPRKEQLAGCLKEFFINNKTLNFKYLNIVKEFKMLHSCKCNDNICNGGKCTEVAKGIVCNCDTTALNGLYCNNELRHYIPGQHNTYFKAKNTSSAHIKITFEPSQVSSNTTYCLLDFQNKEDNITLTTNGTQLFLNSNVIDDINNATLNFVSVMIMNNSFIIKTPYKTISNNYSMSNDLRMHVGYSDNNKCDTYEGTYDISLGESLKPVQELSSILPSSISSKIFRRFQSTSSILIFEPHKQHLKQSYARTTRSNGLLIPIFLTFGAGLVILVLIIMVSVYLTFVRDMNERMQRITNVLNKPRHPECETFSDVSMYGQVQDSEYDYITLNDVHSSDLII